MGNNTPKLSHNDSSTVIENLSNEIFYEIFEYLDVSDINEAFSNLNNRFEDLIRHSPVSLKISLSTKSSAAFKNYFQRIIAPNKHRIISMNILNGSTAKYFTKSLTLDLSFDYLQSLTISGIKKEKLESFLLQLPSLPSLHALTINIYRYPYNFDDDTNPYSAILRLPVLKHAKIFIRSKEPYFPLPSTVSVENFSTIEHLTIEKFTLEALINLITFTPKLRRLTCNQLSRPRNNYVPRSFNMLSNLTHLTIRRCDELFTNLEIFLSKLSSQLQVLRLTVSDIRDYLDADRWESLIINHLPHLRVFEFHFHEFSVDNFVLETHHQRLNRFVSSFWIKRQWLLQLTIDRCSTRPAIIYSIAPYTYKRAITHSEADPYTTISSSTGFFPNLQLNFQPSRNFKKDHLYIKNINEIFTIVSITSLNIEYCCSQQLLLNIISLLPNLNSLSVFTFSTIAPTGKCETLYQTLVFSAIQSSKEYRTIYQSVFNTNQLMTIVLKKLNRFAQVHFLTDLCPQIKYFEVKYGHDIDLEELVRLILMKQLPQLRSLCLRNDLHDDQTVKKLETIIEQEKYTIKREADRLYVLWK